MKWIAAAVGVCLLTAGCTTTIFGSARPAADLKATKTSTATPAPTTSKPPSVPPDGGRKLLLSIPEIEGITGDTGMNNPIVISEPGRSDVGIVPMDCTPIGLPGRAFSIDFHRTGYAGEANRGTGGTSVGQLVATFDSESEADEAVESEKRSWERCPEGVEYTSLGQGADQIRHWVRGPVESTPDRITVATTRQESPRRTCFHAVAAKSNATVESIVCGGGDTTAQANRIADQILAKIPG